MLKRWSAAQVCTFKASTVKVCKCKNSSVIGVLTNFDENEKVRQEPSSLGERSTTLPRYCFVWGNRLRNIISCTCSLPDFTTGVGSISLITSYIQLLSFIKARIVFTSYRSLINLCGALPALTALAATRLRSSTVKYLDVPLS